MRGWDRALVSAGLAMTVLSAQAAAAQDERGQVRAYLEHGMSVHQAAGYARERVIPDLETPLWLNQPHLWPVFLRAGVAYRIYGACSDACGDLDMEIYAANGDFVRRDAARDDTPFVEITPTQTGEHYVRVWLYACDAEPCHVAARVMSGGPPSPH